MTKQIILYLIFTLSGSIYSQEFDFNLMEKLTNISFFSVDDFMIEGYGYKKIKEENDGLKRVYARYYDKDFDNTIIITIHKAPEPTEKIVNGKKYFQMKPNFIEISVAKNYNIREIKDILLSIGFEYIGTHEIGLTAFKKDKFTYLFAKEPNEVGATQIMLITEDNN